FKATVAAARYLKALYATFGDWHLALASYNGGPGRVQRAMKRSGRTDFWSLSASSRFLPRETRNYVPLILAAAIIGRDPLQYGFDVPEVPDQAPPTDTIALAGPVDLDRIAEWIDVPVDTLRALNPSLRRWTTPVRPGIFELRVPRDTRPLIQVRLAEADPSDLTSLGWYTVNRGDTLTSVAKTLGVRRLDLAEANYLSLRARLAPGQQLIVPRAPGAAAAAPDPEPATSARVTYRVRRGDTLSTIARRHGISVASLRRWNDLRGSLIRAGDRLTIYTNRTAAD
ncbi:MAG: LysM peptidoglycan-binding domain-containing protein, partial [Acidimicrobiia bacterium]|nr:LysM peptidoglycan-binding domain-containing protein [Acidimicrobiia bacterium]